MSPEIRAHIEEAISSNKVMLYMKGDKQAPQCGFSAQVVRILDSYGIDYETEDVLANWDVREAIKEFSSWPTVPQLYIDGKFIGGCDITMELHRKGDLKKILGQE